MEVACEEGIGEEDVGVRVFRVALLGEVEHDLGLLVVAEPLVGVDAVDERGGVVGVEFFGGFEVRDRFARLAGAEKVHADEDEHLWVIFLQVVAIGEGFGGVLVAARGFEGEAEVEVPLGAFGIDSDRFAERGFGVRPATVLKELVRSFDMAFGVHPVVHRRGRGAGKNFRVWAGDGST